MSPKQVEIVCAACGADTMLVREPRYEGFRKAGETLKCAACGHEYPTEESVPFKQKKQVSVFDASDASRRVSVFKAGEADVICRYCENYLVNPFTQRCGLHFRTVQATDTCGEFTRRKPPEKQEPAGGAEAGNGVPQGA